jgi:xanthine dehydrogenase small subunit
MTETTDPPIAIARPAEACYARRKAAGVMTRQRMRQHLTFLLNGETATVRDIAPATTLLAWLRRAKRLAGTKEGCAEGDCGACTVVVASLEGGRVAYRAVNACLLFLPMLEGKLVLTVEALAGPGGELHPVQQAMVDCHGSQCGFCTPGFVMSLYAAFLGGERLSRREIDDVLAGNLCRCTGYGPIVAAAERMFDSARPQWDAERRGSDLGRLRAIRHEETVVLEHGGLRALLPASLGELARLYAEHPDATIVAGATDVGLWVTKQHRSLPMQIQIGRVEELGRIEARDGTLRIGAGVTYAAAHAEIARRYPDFGELVRRIGGLQVRNTGTIGGNIANGSPIGDTPPALIALGATLVLRRGESRRRIALEDFFLAYGRQDRRPGELVEAVEMPLLDEPARLRCYKLTKRFDQDISIVCGCFNVAVDGGRVASARIAFGGMAAIPKRARALEGALIGMAWTRATIEAAVRHLDSDFQPISDHRGSSAYRRQAAGNLLRKYFIETTEPSVPTRLAGAAVAAIGS